MEFGPDYFRSVQRYGLGIGINPSDFHTAYADAAGQVDFFEITAPSARHRGPAPYTELRKQAGGGQTTGFLRRGIPELAETSRVLVHSTNVNPVYADPPNEEDLGELRQLLTVSGSPWVTEDLGVWLMSERHVYPHFMPLPLTMETLSVAAANVRGVQEILGRPFNAEFPPMSYVAGDMNAFEFFARLCGMTGCGMCVDVGHVLSYQMARQASPTADFHRIPWDSVTEIHFAGGSIDLVREGYFYQDDHGDREVVSVCFDLIDEVVGSAPNLRAIALELFGARHPQRALQRLRFARERPAIRAWLNGEPLPAEPVPPLDASRRHVKALSVAMFDLLHSDQPLSGDRLAEAGPELTGVFATTERRRWDYDRQSRVLILGNSIASYCPATAGWLQRSTGWTADHLYSRLIQAIDGTVPLSADMVADAFHEVLPDNANERLLHELLRCETWMNMCTSGSPTNTTRHFNVDVQAAVDRLNDPESRLEDLAHPVTLVYLGEGRFARRGAGQPRVQAVTATAVADEPVICGTARCCTGD